MFPSYRRKYHSLLARFHCCPYLEIWEKLDYALTGEQGNATMIRAVLKYLPASILKSRLVPRPSPDWHHPLVLHPSLFANSSASLEYPRWVRAGESGCQSENEPLQKRLGSRWREPVYRPSEHPRYSPRLSVQHLNGLVVLPVPRLVTSCVLWIAGARPVVCLQVYIQQFASANRANNLQKSGAWVCAARCGDIQQHAWDAGRPCFVFLA